MFERISAPAAGGRAHYIVECDEAGHYTYRFTVVGRGDFPVDMLRKDECYPADTESALNIVRWTRETREVVLVSHQPRRWWNPTFDRWRSFGWSVKSDA